MVDFIKIMVLFCIVLLPIVSFKRKRKKMSDVAEQESKQRSEYGVAEDGSIALIVNEEA